MPGHLAVAAWVGLRSMRSLLCAVVVLLLLGAFGPALSQASEPAAPEAGSIPAGCSNAHTRGPGGTNPVGTIAKFSDDCYHMRTGLNAVDSPVIDVLLVVAASPYAERDARMMRQVVDMWDGGFHALARQTGMDWLDEGLEFHVSIDYVDADGSGGEFTTYPIWDPEIVVVTNNPILSGAQGIGIDPVAEEGPVIAGFFGPGSICSLVRDRIDAPAPECDAIGAIFGKEGPCTNVPNPLAGLPVWEHVPGFDSHHDGRSGTYVEDCGGAGGNICFAINNAIDPLPGVVDNAAGMNTFDLVAHEVGHCLTLGHVGDAGDHHAKRVPASDIMAYTGARHHKCASTLDLEVFAATMSRYLPDAPGLLDANDPLGDGRSPFQVQAPFDHRYASKTGLAVDCPRPDDGLVPSGEQVDFDPGVAQVAITEPSPDRQVASGAAVRVAGTLQRENGLDPTMPRRALGQGGDQTLYFHAHSRSGNRAYLDGNPPTSTAPAVLVAQNRISSYVLENELYNPTWMFEGPVLLEDARITVGWHAPDGAVGTNGGSQAWKVTLYVYTAAEQSTFGPVANEAIVERGIAKYATTASWPAGAPSLHTVHLDGVSAAGDRFVVYVRPLAEDPGALASVNPILFDAIGFPSQVTVQGIDAQWPAERVELYDGNTRLATINDLSAWGTTDAVPWETSVALDSGTRTITALWKEADGHVIDIERVTLAVDAANQAPVLDEILDQAVKARDTLVFQVRATDPDGDAVTLGAFGLPAGATFDAASGTFQWTPKMRQVGTHVVEFSASDGSLEALRSVTIQVTRG